MALNGTGGGAGGAPALGFILSGRNQRGTNQARNDRLGSSSASPLEGRGPNWNRLRPLPAGAHFLQLGQQIELDGGIDGVRDRPDLPCAWSEAPDETLRHAWKRERGARGAERLRHRGDGGGIHRRSVGRRRGAKRKSTVPRTMRSTWHPADHAQDGQEFDFLLFLRRDLHDAAPASERAKLWILDLHDSAICRSAAARRSACHPQSESAAIYPAG